MQEGTPRFSRSAQKIVVLRPLGLGMAQAGPLTRRVIARKMPALMHCACALTHQASTEARMKGAVLSRLGSTLRCAHCSRRAEHKQHGRGETQGTPLFENVRDLEN
jgi:hypothetical protein